MVAAALAEGIVKRLAAALGVKSILVERSACWQNPSHGPARRK
jgi:hypothetical protein